MIKTFIIITILLSLIEVKSQTPLSYDICSYLKKFEGNWQYVNGTDTININLRYVRIFDDVDSCVKDLLFGWHEYKKGNIVVESSYQNRNMPILYNDTSTMESRSITGSRYYPGCSPSISIASAGIVDYGQLQKHQNVIMEINSAQNQLTWRQHFGPGFITHTGNPVMTLPKEFVLTKQ